MKTYRDLFKEVYEKYGIQTSTEFHTDPDKELTDQEYQEELKAYKAVQSVLNDLSSDKAEG